MLHDALTRTLYDEICQIPLIDPHSHIDPFAPAARTLDDILGYHYYTELAHSAGMGQAPLRPEVDPARALSGDPRPHGPLRQHGPVRLVPRDRPHLPGLEAERYRRGRRRPTLRHRRKRLRPAGLGSAGLAQVEPGEDLPDQRLRRPARRASTRRATSRVCGPTTSCSISISRRSGSGWRRRPASRSATRRLCRKRSRRCSSDLSSQGPRRAPSHCRQTSLPQRGGTRSGCSPSSAASTACRST